MRRAPSILVSWIVANVGALLLAAAMIGLGLLVTKVVLSVQAIQNADDWLPSWIEERRTPALTDASYAVSMLADRPVLLPLLGAVVVMLVLRKRWRLATFVLQAGLVELLCYAVVVHFVSRKRPDVEQLDELPVMHSFPSGHVAMSVAIYGAMALLLAAHFKDIRVRATIWTIGVAVPLVVAASRIYRGEHHPIDVAGGVVMGIGALCVAAFAARTGRRVAELQATRRMSEAA